jgi:hypothetical protein
VGAGPGDAGKSSVHAGLAGTASPLMLGGAGNSWLGEAEEAAMAATTGATAAAAIAEAGSAKSALGLVECSGEALGGELGMLAWVVSSAASFPNGLAEAALGSVKGLFVGAWAAPGRSQEFDGRAGRSRSCDLARGAAATLRRLAALLRCSNTGSNWVTGLTLRRGAVDMVRTLGVDAGATWTCGGGGAYVLDISVFSLSGFTAICFFLRR